eukprot:SAG11_NODE_118_length_15921_cov_30.283448_4_plen_272_part_00
MGQKTLDEMMRKRTLAEVWSSPGAKQMQRRVADTEVGHERSQSKTGGHLSDKNQSGSRGSCGPKRGGRRAGARGARGQRGRGRGGRRWAGTLGQEALQEENAKHGSGVGGEYKVPLTSSANKSNKKKKSLRVGIWKCFGLSGERMEFLCGSEDGTKPGMFPMKEGGDWILGLTECHGWEQRLKGLMPMKWFLGADRGSNQTGELCGVIQAVLWLLKLPRDDAEAVSICSDSIYALNQVEGRWRMNRNEVLIRCGQRLLAQARQKRHVQFVT